MVKFGTESDRSSDLGVQHQVTAVADQHDDLVLGPRQLHAEAAGDLVAHAGIAVFQVVAADLPRLPQLVQFAGQPAGGAHHDGVRRQHALHRADHLGVRWPSSIGWRGDRGGLLAPHSEGGGQALQPGFRRTMAGECGIQFRQPDACIGDQRLHMMFDSIEYLHIKTDRRRAGFWNSDHDPVVKSCSAFPRRE